jgi:four helix bundle protein
LKGWNRAMDRLHHENLEVYNRAKEFLAFSIELVRRFPKGYADLSDQLRRASISIGLNIAEGAGKASRADAARYYYSARGSALECGAILDACGLLGLATQNEIDQGKARLVSLASMLTRLGGPRRTSS